MISSLLLFLHPIFLFLQDVDPATPPATEEGGGGGGSNLLVPMMLIMGIFYFLLIAPERKKQKKRDAMLKTMKKGERVMTTSGMYGTVVQVKEDVVTLQVAENVRLRFLKSAVQTLLDREETKDTKAASPVTEDEAVQETT